MTELFTPSQEKELSKFGKKPLSEEQTSRMNLINEACKEFIKTIYRNSPHSADQSAAVRYARLAAMQANASVVWDTVMINAESA